MRRAREFMRKEKGAKIQNESKSDEKTPEEPEDKIIEPACNLEEKPEEIPEKVAEKVPEKIPKITIQKNLVESLLESEEEDDEDFDGISDGDDDDDTDGLLIPLENGWVCEKRLADSNLNTYSTHFWSPDGQRHSSLSAIKNYGSKKKLKLNLAIFERALKNNPHK